MNEEITEVLDLTECMPETVVPVSSLPKAINGWRLCKLSQYPARKVENINEATGELTTENKPRSSWLYTTAFTTSIDYHGIKLAVSKWSKGTVQVAKKDEISLWIEGTDEELLKLIEDDRIYIYYHESETKLPLSVDEYKSQIIGKSVPTQVLDTDDAVSEELNV